MHSLITKRNQQYWSRRQILQGTGGIAASLALSPLAACKEIGSARTFAQERVKSLAIPPLDRGKVIDGERRFNLSVSHGEKTFAGGRSSRTIGINSSYLGPTLEMRRGERVRFNVENRIDEDISVHWHGFELPAAADGGPHQAIAPGARWTPSFEVRQRASLYWYHSHALHRSGPQVYAGLAAGIYVRDEDEDRLELPNDYGVDDIPLMVQDRVLGADGSLIYPTGMHARMMGVTGDSLFVNGTPSPVFEATTGLLRLRVLNASNARSYNFFLDGGRTMMIIASDGGLLERPISARSLKLAPGERAQLLIDLSDGRPARLRASSPDNAMGMMGGMGGMMGDMGRGSRDRAGERDFSILDIMPAGNSVQKRQVPGTLVMLPEIDPSSAIRTRRFVLDMGMGMRGGFTINGAEMDMNVIDERVSVNQWEIWEIGNQSMMAHPFHIHNVQFRILDRSGRPPEAAEMGLKDTVMVNPGERVRLLLRFEENTDPDLPYMYHCHILEHEDAGMMGQFVVTA